VDVMPAEIPGANKAPSRFFDDMQSSLTRSEWLFVRDAGPIPEESAVKRFFILWTLKESFLKAVGSGLSSPLQEVEFTIDPTQKRPSSLPASSEIQVALRGRRMDNWHFDLQHLDERHIVCVATGPIEDAAPSFRSALHPAGSSTYTPPQGSMPFTLLPVSSVLEPVPQRDSQ